MEKHYIPGTKGSVFSLRGDFSFGVDSILLSAFSKTKSVNLAVDLCSGSGIVALRNTLLYRPKKMIGMEIQASMCHLMREAVKENSLDPVMEVWEGTFKEQGKRLKESVDIITCNPPYFKRGEGIQNDKMRMTVSRHELKMTLEDVFIFAAETLKEGGKLFLIQRPHRMGECIYFGKHYGLPVKRLRSVQGKTGRAPKMVLMEFRNRGGDFLNVEAPIILYEEDGIYTQEVLRAYEGEKL